MGDALVLFNGQGGEYAATITAVDRHSVNVKTGPYAERDTESPLSIHLGIALSRGERMDWIVQKSTELGVSTISPLFTEHAGVRLDAQRAGKKTRHWQQVAISACEQCGRNRLPTVAAPQALADWLDSTDAQSRLVLHPRGEPAAALSGTPASVALLVGPEGGLSDVEIARSAAAGFAALQLGPRVLRTETAPLAAIAVLQARWGDFAGD